MLNLKKLRENFFANLLRNCDRKFIFKKCKCYSIKLLLVNTIIFFIMLIFVQRIKTMQTNIFYSLFLNINFKIRYSLTASQLKLNVHTKNKSIICTTLEIHF